MNILLGYGKFLSLVSLLFMASVAFRKIIIPWIELSTFSATKPWFKRILRRRLKVMTLRGRGGVDPSFELGGQISKYPLLFVMFDKIILHSESIATTKKNYFNKRKCKV